MLPEQHARPISQQSYVFHAVKLTSNSSLTYESSRLSSSRALTCKLQETFKTASHLVHTHTHTHTHTHRERLQATFKTASQHCVHPSVQS
mmetsp:Transcript_19522/g.42345  ORF Transcript_19522/g.42345 Transcript_19522/m.42345 type:complete len:90 (-) Transcript_19522:3973-4242(-)